MNQIVTITEQRQHYAEVRLRLRGPLSPRSSTMRHSAETALVAPFGHPKPASGSCPINMLAMPSWRFLVALAALRAGVTPEDILGRSRSRKVSSARHDAIALIYSHQKRGLSDIGRLLGRNHSSVFNSLIRFRELKPLVVAAPTPAAPMPAVALFGSPAQSTAHHQRCLEELEEENRQLRDLLGMTTTFDFIVRCRDILDLSASPAKLLSILVAGKVRTSEGLYAAYCGAVGGQPAPKIIAVQIVHLRKALRPYGVAIKCVWGEGFFMTAADRKHVREVLGMEAAGL